ncbi:arad-like aldolase/epimerase [Guyanagaster necrorhizus]|uniref:Arad-like aldolase/epimerase n=1 Tax=Guyanagaster necrorhizus TaxID=856835 RepID=A0A9P7VX85_9AGAR|nr:arad-like aldolase/epimerase [Guyanagaster necrorhizus MCA 3950]KAG7448614.1 arad-like aldolase/epimerase [Guyanagaster necrorhizus MCA 3950]
MSPSANGINGTSNGAFHQSLDGLEENPLRRTWRGNKQGTIELGTVPTFDNPYEEREWIKEHMAAAFRYWGKIGFAEGVSGHITVRDPVLPDHYWMNPFAEHFSTMTKSMLCLVGPDGYVTKHGAQLPINTAGFYIHSAIHKARPDVKAAAHCHSVNAKAWAAFGRPIETLTQDSCLFYDNHCVYENFGGIVLAQEEGENIAKAMGPKFKTCILQNHGLLTLGNTVDEAVYLFAALDRQCKVQLMAEAAAANGLKKTIISKEDAEFTARTIQWWENTYFQPEYKLLLQETNGAFLL